MAPGLLSHYFYNTPREFTNDAPIFKLQSASTLRLHTTCKHLSWMHKLERINNNAIINTGVLKDKKSCYM